jgi:hypothetical protein
VCAPIKHRQLTFSDNIDSTVVADDVDFVAADVVLVVAGCGRRKINFVIIMNGSH